MTDTVPTVQELVRDDVLLRRTAGEVLNPGPWEHKVEDDCGTMRCAKCRTLILTPLSYDESGEGLNDDCPVPDPATGSLADIAEELAKKCQGIPDTLFGAIREVYANLHIHLSDEEDVWRWFSLYAATYTRILCCLVALMKARVE